MKNVRDAGFLRKRGGNAGSGPPPSRPSINLAKAELGVIESRKRLVSFFSVLTALS